MKAAEGNGLSNRRQRLGSDLLALASMRQKKHKRVSRSVRFLKLAFDFRVPYKVQRADHICGLLDRTVTRSELMH